VLENMGGASQTRKHRFAKIQSSMGLPAVQSMGAKYAFSLLCREDIAGRGRAKNLFRIASGTIGLLFSPVGQG
jgi:hypothetical protein